MKRAYGLFTGIFIGIALIGGTLVHDTYDSSRHNSPHDYVLPVDNFDKQTIDTIQSCLMQYNVANTPQDHEVYMVTGGLGIANPRITTCDSDGNMEFKGNLSEDPTYNIQFLSDPPKIAGNEPGSWVLKHTKSGNSYYEWDMPQILMTQFYFKNGSTYVWLKVGYLPNTPKPTFPEALLSHLVPIGNSVTQ